MYQVMPEHFPAARQCGGLQADGLPGHGAESGRTFIPERAAGKKYVPLLHHFAGLEIGEGDVLGGEIGIEFAPQHGNFTLFHETYLLKFGSLGAATL